MNSLIHSLLMSISLASLLLTAGCPLPTFCGDLLYDEATNKCVCPPGTLPNYELGICEGTDGTVIPWAEFDVPYRLVDAGMSMMDSGPRDMSTDTLDGGAADMTLATPDAGPEERDGGPDASLDAGVDDTGPDTSSDSGPDTSTDATHTTRRPQSPWATLWILDRQRSRPKRFTYHQPSAPSDPLVGTCR